MKILQNSFIKLNSISILLCIALFKILLFFLFSSEYSNVLFIPFLVKFANQILTFQFISPWADSIPVRVDAFPYHPSMLYLYTLFQLPIALFKLGSFAQSIGFIIPTLLADLLIFRVMLQFFPDRERIILWFYGLSPVILYSIYIHGQLDLWPTALLLLSVSRIFKGNYKESAFYFGLAMTFKLHIIAVLPLFIVYIFRKERNKSLFNFFSIVFLIYGLISFPWYFDSGFRTMVLFNSRQDLIWKVFYKVGDNSIYLSIAAILILYLRFLGYTKLNKDLFITWVTILFAVFVLFIPPAPGWYVWFTPFLLYFYFKYLKKQYQIFGLYGFFCISYVLFFLFVWKGDYIDLFFLGKEVNLKSMNPKFSGLLYTFLQTSLAANLFIIYRIGVRSNRIYKKPNSILIGIGGDSGAGKSSLLHSLEKLLSPSVTLLEGDGDHRWERGNLNYQTITHLNPRANYLERQAENLIRLKKGEVIYRPDYDHDTGKFTEPQPVQPSDFIILSGLHTFYLPKMRKVIDIKIFLDTEENLRLHWKILRDTKKRGYSPKKIQEQIAKRAKDSDKYIQPQKNFADLTIEYFSRNKFKVGDQAANPHISLKISISSEYHMEDLILRLEEGGWLSEWDYGQDLKSQYLIFDHHPSPEELSEMASIYIPVLEEIISPFQDWENSLQGIVQLFVLVMISKKYLEFDNA
ncbi:MAG TPA: hypothetical protein PK079_11205 [Leptospiraceae bacterium]|nr:hypothetical protein [Leptospiraceae bacterium]HMW03435.1 hypothetical protein [Leptospiraceae bacterium]HMX31568.1 hypothetical protein [Leptospiraceae bacterium]HMY29645.1 hypothetical protein [Leptospiraceae bacterium]HMZ66173.1 hypothetical protein [Leptospiraceae bacterium]